MAKSFSYVGFDRYTENSTVTKKISGGFSLNLGLFSIGTKKKMAEVFTQSKINDSNSVFGELSVEIRDSAYTMQTSTNITKKILLDYLTPDFKDELYNTSPSELFNNYGGFVLSNFVVGGRATAIYAGSHNTNESVTQKEKDMNTDISASYGFKVKDTGGKISADLGFGKGFANGATSSNQITKLEMSIRTIGGSTEFARFSMAKTITDMNLDISAWVTSLNDKSTHSIIDISDNGLIPISDYIMEKNLKNEFTNIYTTGVMTIKELQEPYIEILGKKAVGSSKFRCYVYLNTRFGDKILCEYMAGSDYINMTQVIDKMKNKYNSIFGIKMIYTEISRADCMIDDEYYRDVITLFFGNQVEKYVYNNTIYILFTDENGTKYGYTIHDDYILDTYVIRKYVNNLPVIQIAPTSLLYYTLIAL